MKILIVKVFLDIEFTTGTFGIMMAGTGRNLESVIDFDKEIDFSYLQQSRSR